MSFKIWKKIKIKRVRVPDILCLRCARRVESRAKTKLEITMSHSLSNPERGWDFGLDDNDLVALVRCERTGTGPLDWSADPLVQYIPVASLRHSWEEGQVQIQRPKGAQEGFESRVTWPAAVASTAGVIEATAPDAIRYRRLIDQRAVTVHLNRPIARLTPTVGAGAEIRANQIMATNVRVLTAWPCTGGSDVAAYARLCESPSLSDRYTAVKALGHFPGAVATDALRRRLLDSRDHIYVRVEAAAGLMRWEDAEGIEFLQATLSDQYLENRLEAAIILGEVGTPDAERLLVEALTDNAQDAEIRAGAAWSLGEMGARAALPSLIERFAELDPIIKIEAARALAKLARTDMDSVLQAFPTSTPEQRPGVSWALSKAGNVEMTRLLPMLSDEDSRQWVAYIIGTQDSATMLPGIEELAARDPQVYFAVTALWKILASWVNGLEEN